jgi:hypothetical protein
MPFLLVNILDQYFLYFSMKRAEERFSATIGKSFNNAPPPLPQVKKQLFDFSKSFNLIFE